MQIENQLLNTLMKVAKVRHGGHFAIMKFTTNWRVCFGTPADRDDIQEMPVGDTFAEAAAKALELELLPKYSEVNPPPFDPDYLDYLEHLETEAKRHFAEATN
jgi:hypothetical protein